MLNKRTVKSVVFEQCSKLREAGVNVRTVSQNDIEVFCQDIRLNFAHTIPYPYKDSSVNRYVEQWLKLEQNKIQS